MNATANSRPKQVGDIVRINAGKYARQVGVLIEKGHGWVVELETGEKVKISPRMADHAAPAHPAESPAAGQPAAAAQQSGEAPKSPAAGPPVGAEPAESEDEAGNASGEDNPPVDIAITPELASLSVRQLWDLAKKRGVSVARTKADFHRIIKAMNPDEDMTVLKGKALFDRVSELHISRLRSKRDLLVIFAGQAKE